MKYREIIKNLMGLRSKKYNENMVNTFYDDDCTVKNWVAFFKKGKFSIQEDERRLRFKT